MGNGYKTPDGDGLGPLIRQLEDLQRRLKELETPTGTSLNSLVAQVQAALAELDATVSSLVETYVTAFSYDQATIDGKIASPGAIAPSTVNSSGDVNVGGALRAMSVPTTILTHDYYATWATRDDGQIGYVPSSRRFKQDIESVILDPTLVSALQVVTFRYINAVEKYGDDAAVEVGLIAEEVHALGLTWLVDYDEDGLPFGVRYERLSMALLPVVQDHERRLQALEG